MFDSLIRKFKQNNDEKIQSTEMIKFNNKDENIYEEINEDYAIIDSSFSPSSTLSSTTSHNDLKKKVRFIAKIDEKVPFLVTNVRKSSILKKSHYSDGSSASSYDETNDYLTNDFNQIVEDFVCRLMCKSHGNNNCQLCNKYKSKSLNSDSFMEKQNSKVNLNVNRQIDSRLSFRVTNVTLEELKLKFKNS